jgi:hypothetical protein
MKFGIIADDLEGNLDAGLTLKYRAQTLVAVDAGLNALPEPIRIDPTIEHYHTLRAVKLHVRIVP